MSLLLKQPFLPMEALSVSTIPTGPDWQYEPKWDGFRCLAFRDLRKVSLQSKSGQPLGRYFPEVTSMLQSLKPERFALDGELVVPVHGRLSFDDLLMRIHPAASRVAKLAHETPAVLVVFDFLVDDQGKSLISLKLRARRKRLEHFISSILRYQRTNRSTGALMLTPATDDIRQAQRWFRSAGRGALDGLIAKRLDDIYHPGERAMLKIKPTQTADCVVGGFRYASGKKVIGSLLLGLYDQNGLLHHVGFTSSLTAKDRRSLTPKLQSLIKQPGFTGRAPGGPSRWSSKRSMEWLPLSSQLVVEVQYDHFSAGRFRHGAKFLRWRPDKAPSQCTFDQLPGTRVNLWKIMNARLR